MWLSSAVITQGLHPFPCQRHHTSAQGAKSPRLLRGARPPSFPTPSPCGCLRDVEERLELMPLRETVHRWELWALGTPRTGLSLLPQGCSHVLGCSRNCGQPGHMVTTKQVKPCSLTSAVSGSLWSTVTKTWGRGHGVNSPLEEGCDGNRENKVLPPSMRPWADWSMSHSGGDRIYFTRSSNACDKFPDTFVLASSPKHTPICQNPVLTSARFMSTQIKTSIRWLHLMSLLPFNTFLHNLTLEPFFIICFSSKRNRYFGWWSLFKKLLLNTC